MKQFFNGIKDGAKDFGEHIAIIINTILLSVVYFLGVGLTAIAAKLLRKKFLETNISKASSSYWSDLNLKNKSKEESYRQF